MARFSEEDRTDEDIIQSKSSGDPKYKSFVQPLKGLTQGKRIRFTPETNAKGELETLRALKMLASRAATETGVKISYREDGDELVVWLQEPRPEGAPRRGRPPKPRQEA